MSASASSPGGSSRKQSSSAITAAATAGQHQLKIDNYSPHQGGAPRRATAGTSTPSPAGSGHGRLLTRDRRYISLQLVLDGGLAPAAGAVKAQFTLSLLDHAGAPVPSTVRKSPVVRSPAVGWWFRRFISKVELERPLRGLLRDDSFILQCDVVVLGRFRAVTAAPFVAVPPPDLHRHLGDLLVSGAGGERFGAHRCVLAARSPVFRAKLLSSMREGTSGCAIHIEDMDARVFGALLQFVYTDELPEAEEREEAAMAQHLLEAADRFNLQRLKLLCEDKLCGCIDTSSVVATLVLAEQHCCQGLKDKCFEFLKSTGLNAAMATDGFNHLASSCPTVLDELMSKLALH